MKKFGDIIVKNKISILIITFLLVIPSIIGYALTKINYDILVYLPSDIETLKGEKILTDDFHMGAFSIVVVENMSSKDILELEDKYRQIDTVTKVVSISDFAGTNIPVSMLPEEITSKVAKDDSELILVLFSESTSDDKTLAAVDEMRKISDKRVKIGGMSAMVLDTKELFNSEMLLYVVIAVILCIIVLELSLDSYVVPFLLMSNIGIAILFNMGSNIFLGNISYITKAIAAVLQLGVTTDFSIFLYHKYEKLKDKYKSNDEAMSEAIHDTFQSVFGSSLTTIAGFLALCTMKLTLGVDIGLVMAKGVLIGVICVLTVFPALLLTFDKAITKTKHKELLPKFELIKNFVVNHYIIIFIIFLILLIPSFLAQRKTEVYYKLDESIPENYGYTMATKKLHDDYNIVSFEMILIDKNMENYKVNEMVEEIKNIDGISFVLSPSAFTKYGLSDEMIPSDIRNMYETNDYKMIIASSDYDIATNELNEQIAEVNKIIKSYDEDAILAGEGPLMKDLVTTTDIDFKNVNYTSIAVIFIIMLIVLKSISLPILLVTAIEFAIFINMGVPYFTGTELPFIASVVIGTIQLGATIDYAILLTTKYLDARKDYDKNESIKIALDNSVTSIFVSAMCFFGATIGVSLVSKIDMIGSLCTLMSRGAIISMIVVIMVVPSILLIFDNLIMKTTLINVKGMKKMNNKKLKKVLSLGLVLSMIFSPLSSMALTREETVYSKLYSDGSVKTTLVSEHLINNEKADTINDITDLTNIININGDNKFNIENNNINWNANGEDIFYQGKTDKELPINLNVTYKLDDEEISLDDLIGKSGHVEINIKYTNNLKREVYVNGILETLYQPFVVATVTNISNINNSNINVTNGKVVDNGLGYMIFAISSPGLYESLGIDEVKNLDNVIISFDTKKFELSSIYSIATPKLLETGDLDIFDKLNTLYSSVDRLQYSINQIASGSSLINENMAVVLEKIDQIKNGSISIDEGLKQILFELENAKVALNQSIDQEKLEKMNTLVETNTTTINKLTAANASAKEAYINYHLDQVSYNEIANLVISMSVPEEQIETYVTNLTNAKFTYENMYESNEQLIALLTANNQGLNTSIETFKTSVTKINELIDKLNLYLGQLEEGTKQLSDGTIALRDGVEVLNGKMGELTNGINMFNAEGISQLSSYSYRIKQVSGKINALVDLSNNYKNFALVNSDLNGSTKFVYVIDGKSAPKEVKKVETTKKKENIIDKFFNLFK